MNNLEAQIYPHLPIFMQNLACNVHGWRQRQLRYGGQFEEMLAWLNETEWWSQDRIEQYQAEKLQALVQYAYENVPYYRHLLDEEGIRPQDIKSRSDLDKIPVLTKEDVRENLPLLVSTQFAKKDLVHCHTSGTSGKSLQFYMEPSAFQFRWAVWWRHKMRFNIAFDAPYATFTGLNVVPLNQKKPPFWRENWLMKQTVFTMHHIVPEKVESIVGRLNQGGFEYYSGYPSVLYVLANLIIEKNLKIETPPKVIFTGAENLYDYQRKSIAEAFQCLVTDQYGFSEGCGNASRCEHDMFHEDFEYGILECGEAVIVNENTIQGKLLLQVLLA